MDSVEGLKIGYFNEKDKEKPAIERIPRPESVANAIGTCLGKFAVDRKTGKPVNYETAVSALITWAMNNKPESALQSEEIMFNRAFANELNVLKHFFGKFTDISYDYADALAIQADIEKARRVNDDEQVRELLTDVAVFNQRLADSIYAVSSPQATDKDRLNAAIFIQTANALASRDNPFGRELSKMLNAARAQAATMRLLKQQGFDIIVPDPEDRTEVHEWDVMNKTDFVAISPPPQSAPILVDMKTYAFASQLANKDADAVSVTEMAMITRNMDVVNGLKGILKVNETMVKHVEIRVPADDQNINLLGTFAHDAISTDILKKLHAFVPTYAQTP
ncbi:MAG: hypothetical protein RI947_132 [Candidatus Parcubacteria bacterium]|jgi:hypothetical protein